MTVRVLRLLEYTFETNEAAQTSMDRWAVPANGGINFGKGTIRSAIITELLPELPQTTGE